jgi:hypothetical protein
VNPNQSLEPRQPVRITKNASTSFPSDLRDWLDARSLVVFVLEAVQSHYCSVCDGADRVRSSDDVGPELVLGVLTYCHAIGGHSPADIAQRMSSDPAVRYLCLNRRVEARRLQLLRGQNHELLKRCLTSLLRTVWESKHGHAASATEAGLDFAGQRSFGDEAEQRIQWAIWTDLAPRTLTPNQSLARAAATA